MSVRTKCAEHLYWEFQHINPNSKLQAECGESYHQCYGHGTNALRSESATGQLDLTGNDVVSEERHRDDLQLLTDGAIDGLELLPVPLGCAGPIIALWRKPNTSVEQIIRLHIIDLHFFSRSSSIVAMFYWLRRIPNQSPVLVLNDTNVCFQMASSHLPFINFNVT